MSCSAPCLVLIPFVILPVSNDVIQPGRHQAQGPTELCQLEILNMFKAFKAAFFVKISGHMMILTRYDRCFVDFWGMSLGLPILET